MDPPRTYVSPCLVLLHPPASGSLPQSASPISEDIHGPQECYSHLPPLSVKIHGVNNFNNTMSQFTGCWPELLVL